MIKCNKNTSITIAVLLFFLIEKIKSTRYKHKKKSPQLAEMICLANIN